MMITRFARHRAVRQDHSEVSDYDATQIPLGRSGTQRRKKAASSREVKTVTTLKKTASNISPGIMKNSAVQAFLVWQVYEPDVVVDQVSRRCCRTRCIPLIRDGIHLLLAVLRTFSDDH